MAFDSATGAATPTHVLRTVLQSEPAFYGTLMYVEFLHQYCKIFITKATPEEAITSAAFCIMFIGLWEANLRADINKNKGNLNMRDNFLTVQTKQDVLISCNCVILACKIMRKYCEDAKVMAIAWCREGGMGSALQAVRGRCCGRGLSAVCVCGRRAEGRRGPWAHAHGRGL
jgi:hypothetical protein